MFRELEEVLLVNGGPGSLALFRERLSEKGKSFFLGGSCDPHRNYAVRLGKTQHLLILPGVFVRGEHLQ